MELGSLVAVERTDLREPSITFAEQRPGLAYLASSFTELCNRAMASR